MSFFPLSAYPSSSTSSFSPLFRLLDDFEQHQSGNSSSNGGHHSRHNTSLRTFTPKFDVKEIADAYELHGELPGIEQKDVEIEFTDAQTLVIKGRTEKSYTRGSPSAGFVEDGEKHAQLTEGGENGKHVIPHKASVEDANDENENTTVTKSGNKEVSAKKDEKKEDVKYWVSERSIGQFSRTFTFPSRVDQDGVKASMKNGILSIVVPKMKKAEGRKISIQ